MRLSQFIAAIFLAICLTFMLTIDRLGHLFDDYRAKDSVIKYNELLATPFESAFKDYYAKQLDSLSIKRSEGFNEIFLLAREQSNKTGKSVTVVETGSMRRSIFLFSGDGSSTLIFNHFVNDKQGKVYTVDLDSRCKEIIENIYQLKNVYSYSMDSVEYLKNFPNPQDITILYLDSFDVDFKNPEASANHHLKEIKVIFDKLSPGTIIAIDDNKVIDGKSTGKGYLVEEFFKNNSVPLIYDGYIKIFQIESKPKLQDN